MIVLQPKVQYNNFPDKDYNIFALIAHRGGLISKIQSINETQFNIFFPSDDMLKRTEYNGDFIQYLKGNPYIINDEQIQVANAEDGTLGNLNTTQAQEMHQVMKYLYPLRS